MTAETTETKSIGRYLVDGMIGEGAMAEVFKAYDPEIDRTVAVKVLKDALCICPPSAPMRQIRGSR